MSRTCGQAAAIAHRVHGADPRGGDGGARESARLEESVRLEERLRLQEHCGACADCDRLVADLDALRFLLADAFVESLRPAQRAAFALKLRGTDRAVVWDEAGAIALRWVRMAAAAAAVLVVSATAALVAGPGGGARLKRPAVVAVVDVDSQTLAADARLARGGDELARAGVGLARAEVEVAAGGLEAEETVSAEAASVDTEALVFGESESVVVAVAELALGANVQWGGGW